VSEARVEAVPADSSYGGVVPSVEDVGAAVAVTRDLIERAQAFVDAAAG
jgi:hypothetical protein